MSATAPKTPRGAALLSTLLLAAPACMSHSHSIGLGPTGTGERSARQVYVLFGLLRANDVDAQRMSDGLTSYSITTEFALLDLVLAPLLLPLTITTRTVTVRT